MFLLAILSAFSFAAEIEAGLKCLGIKPRMGDTFTFSEACDAKRVPINEPGVSIAGARTKSGATAGAKTTIYQITKGNEMYELRVPVSVTPEDLRAGRFGDPADCTHKVSFKLADPFAKDAVVRSSGLEKTEANR